MKIPPKNPYNWVVFHPLVTGVFFFVPAPPPPPHRFTPPFQPPAFPVAGTQVVGDPASALPRPRRAAPCGVFRTVSPSKNPKRTLRWWWQTPVLKKWVGIYIQIFIKYIYIYHDMTICVYIYIYMYIYIDKYGTFLRFYQRWKKWNQHVIPICFIASSGFNLGKMQINNPNQQVNRYRNDAAVREKQTQWIAIAFLETKNWNQQLKKRQLFYVDVYFIEPTHFGVCWISLKPCWSISCPTNPLHLGTMFHWSAWGHFQEWDFTLETSNFCYVPLRENLYQLNLPRDFLLENPNLRKTTKMRTKGTRIFV